MAKGILEFDLSEPDDAMAHLRAVKSTDMAIVLHEIHYNLHRRVERDLEAREMKGVSISPFDVINIYKDTIRELFEDEGLNIDKLIV